MAQSRSEEIREHMLAWRNIDTGDECPDCGGSGVKTYANTSTWRHGFGGQMMCSDVCDKCWGSGSKSRQWANLRQLYSGAIAIVQGLFAVSLLTAIAECSPSMPQLSWIRFVPTYAYSAALLLWIKVFREPV